MSATVGEVVCGFDNGKPVGDTVGIEVGVSMDESYEYEYEYECEECVVSGGDIATTVGEIVGPVP